MKYDFEIFVNRANTGLLKFKPINRKVRKGYLSRYAKLVTSASMGAVLK